MADNYIEKQYEQYEARKAAWKKACKYGKKGTATPSKPANKQKEPTLSGEGEMVKGIAGTE